MQKTGTSRTLKWILYGVGIGTLIASGIYLRKGMEEGFDNWNAIRMALFFLVGTVCILMYGENKH